jgi:hypothetical protein
MVGPPFSISSKDLLEAIMSDPSEKPTTGGGCLLRTYWMMVGNALVALAAIFIAEDKGVSFTSKDILYWLAVGSVITGRYLDIRFMNGQTADGKPATMKDCERYTTVYGGVAVLGWIACHLISAIRG